MAKKDKPAAAPPAMSVEQIVNAITTGNVGAFGGAAAKPRTFGPGMEAIAEGQAVGALPEGFVPWTEGDEWVFGMAPDDKARVKAYMASSGLYGTKAVRGGGSWDSNDAEALSEVLAFANAQGIEDIREAARRYAEYAQTAGPLAKAPRQPLVARIANPASVRQVIRKTSMDLLGQRLSDEEEARLIQGFQGQDVAFQQQVHAAGAAGGAVAESLTAQEYAEEALQNKPQAGAQRYLDAFKAIHQSMTSTVTPMGRTTQGGGVQY